MPLFNQDEKKRRLRKEKADLLKRLKEAKKNRAQREKIKKLREKLSRTKHPLKYKATKTAKKFLTSRKPWKAGAQKSRAMSYGLGQTISGMNQNILATAYGKKFKKKKKHIKKKNKRRSITKQTGRTITINLR